MNYLKFFNENKDNTKTLIRDGLEELMWRTHLVKNQVNENIDKFLNNLNLNKFENKFGKITKVLGAGVFGAVYQLDNGKILKITFDFHEAPFVYEYCKLKNTEYFVKVDSVYKIKFGDTNVYIIVRDPIKIINNPDKYYNEIKKAENTMYKISPVWRGTHLGNFGLQNGKVVLYDGFCKKVKVDEKKIPFLKL